MNISLVGMMGSGKTTIAKLLKEKYLAKLIDADEIVKEFTVPGTNYMNAIKEIQKRVQEKYQDLILK